MDTTAPSSPDHPPPLVARAYAVTQVTPAKKITFYKSGDPQFSGVKMAISRRSFKSFSALMDDLSHKVPLPFGVRTITTPRGTHSINKLEQLEDGRSYICSDKKYVQPISTSGPVRKMAALRTSHPVSARKQGQQEGQEDEYPAAHFQQVPKLRKKITLVKNGDPSFRRSIILNRRNARNFKTFLEDASDLLQYTVRRLYTVEGSRVENIQAVLQSPSILICVGREPFKPIRAENVRKSIADKLPGLGTHPNIQSESMDNKKNSNFGLKAKKSVIHPRSASSNKTRFSLSSEKSYPDGINMSPANSGFASFTNSCTHAKSEDTAHSLVNDDIEKRVHVNKDGSLSVEMKVRFRLLNEETLQWSTQIKKSSTLGKTKCDQLLLCEEEDIKPKEEVNPDVFSETDDSFYPCDADSYSSKHHEDLEDMYCSHCGMQCQEYDIWKNPLHTTQQDGYVKRSTWQTRSSSSTSSHRKLMYNQKTSIDSLHTTSSEEYKEHIVHKTSSYSEIRDNKETRVRYSSVSRCTSQSGHSTPVSNTNIKAENGHKNPCICQHQSCPCLKSKEYLEDQDSVTESCKGKYNLRSEGGSVKDCTETSPLSCNSESKGHICKIRENIISQSSVQSRKSYQSMHKRESVNINSFQSNTSVKEEDEQDRHDRSKSVNNNQGTPYQNDDYNEQCICDFASHKHQMAIDQENDKLLYDTVASRTNLSESENCSTPASSCSKKDNKKDKKSNGSQMNNQGSRSSSCYSKQNSDILLQDDRSLGPYEKSECEKYEILKSSSPANSNKSSCANCEKQHLHSNRSLHSLSSETALCHEQDSQRTTNGHDSCDESSKSYLESKQGDDILISEEEEKCSLPNLLSSSKSQSFSSKCNCVRCPENCSTSSGVSLNYEKKSKDPELSNDTGDNDSLKSSVTSQKNKKQNSLSQKGEESSKASGSETGCAHSPSPPKGKPTNRQLRATKYKYSSSSFCSDTVKMNGENPETPSSSTPESKNIGASQASTETCKKLRNTVNSPSSTEVIPNTKKRKNSSSYSKRKLKGESIDDDSKISSELIPSTLPNVTSEEVVHEWLRKIPSQTTVVEYDIEDSHAKECTETQDEAAGCQVAKEIDDKQMIKDTIVEMQDTNEIKSQLTNIKDIVNPEIDKCCKDENNELVLSEVLENNVKCNSVTVEPIFDKKSLPSNIQTSVQIMKALLSPLQDSKFDRSNSLPEVSPTMGRKLSNSAQVLISCLASLQLLDGCLPNAIDQTHYLNKPKYNDLIHIFQALWEDGPAIKCGSNNTSGNQTKMPSKPYSREDEITPVSSSGVDVNSGSGASGDGSVAGGGECTVKAEKLEECKLPSTAKVAENKNDMPETELDTAATGGYDAKDEQCTTEIASTMICNEVCADETNSCNVDENMNEKKMEDGNRTMLAFESKNGIGEALKTDCVNDVNGELRESMENQEYNKDSMNILSDSENKPQSNESQESNSRSDDRSPVKNGSRNDKPSVDADPIWVLKLLKKIEKEFMVHYVDAMNEFKIRWNLENNDNLDEMIAELKNEVGQRIQKSIETELRKIQSRAGQNMPMPPSERRKSSLQADERRKRLQTMHKRSVLQNNRAVGTNELSCETDEEDLTFSASFGDDFNGQDNNDEFCPCETCMRKKKTFKIAKPKAIAADAPIVRAFDLQQILKMKRDNNEVKNNEILPSVEESNHEQNEIDAEINCSDTNEVNQSEIDTLCNSTLLRSKSLKSEDELSVEDKNEDGNTDGLKCEEAENQEDIGKILNDDLDREYRSNDEKEEGTDNATIEKTDRLSYNVSVDAHRMSMECPTENEIPDFSNEEKQSEQEHSSVDLSKDYTAEIEETLEASPDVDESTARQSDGHVSVDRSEHEDNDELNETPNYAEGFEGGETQECTDALELNDSLLQKSCLGQCSIITHNGSFDDIEGQYKEMNNNTEETSPNDQSGTKQSQMYPSSSSDEEDRASVCISPISSNKNKTMAKVYINSKGSFDGSENKLKTNLDDEIIEQDDLDF
ncbi:retinitis pigmentosa 1-like 1 protein [Discoglossus pictus]